MHTNLDDLKQQLLIAKQMKYILHLELNINSAEVCFSPSVKYQTIHEVVKHINQKYKDVAWVPSSLYLVNPRKQIKIFYKRDHA